MTKTLIGKIADTVSVQHTHTDLDTGEKVISKLLKFCEVHVFSQTLYIDLKGSSRETRSTAVWSAAGKMTKRL